MVLPNLNHLKYFVDAVDCGSISGAADKNFVTHPAISRAINSLEKNFDVKLLIHKKRFFEVTPDGYTVAEKARLLLNAVGVFQTNNILAQNELSGTVSIGISRAIGQVFLSPLLKEIDENFPKIKIKIQFGTTGEIIERVMTGSVDLGIAIGQQKMPTLKQVLLKQGEFVLIAGTSMNPHANKNISKASYVLTEPRLETEVLQKMFYQKYKTQLSLKYEVASWDMITRLVAKGHGIGLVPDILLKSKQNSEFKQIFAPWFNSSYKIYLHQSKSQENNSAKKALASLIESLFKKIYP